MHPQLTPQTRVLLPAVLAAAVLGLVPSVASAWLAPTTRYVNANPVSGHSDVSCRSAGYSTIQSAVDAANPGDRVIVCPGTYDEGVLVGKRISLIGFSAVIDAGTSSFGNGVQIEGPGGSGSSVEGFKITNAKFEGILVGTAPVAPTTTDGEEVASGQPVKNVRIYDNVVVANDTGFATTDGECFSTPQAPGDCGEAIHLVSVTNSEVAGNRVTGNAGGILLTDEFGANAHNLLRANESSRNEEDCGITLASHRAAVVPGTLQPTGEFGVFDNTVLGNVAIDNGVKGQGAGILMGGGAPFSGVYSNVIRDNVARGNGLAGVTIHQHLAGDLNGNVIEDNALSENNLDGDFDFEAAQATETTDILVASGAPPHAELPPFLLPSPIKGTVIRGNWISAAKVGIWTLNVEEASTEIFANWFGPGVTTHLSTN